MTALAGYGLEDLKIKFWNTSKKVTAETLERENSLKENSFCSNGREEREKGGEWMGHAESLSMDIGEKMFRFVV